MVGEEPGIARKIMVKSDQPGYPPDVSKRFRLRFLLQEFDLRGPEILLGRSPECQITIEDPLVSRQHARIVISDEAEIQDMGSRNGVRVNGERITAPQQLSHGDRIRIGTQELVFFLASRRKRSARTTGFMTVCRSCATPFPESASGCPHCGEVNGEDTISGMVVEPRRTWTFELIGEVIERALNTNRLREAIRMMRRAAREIDDRLITGEHLDQEQLSKISAYALRLADKSGDVGWLHWALNVHRQQALFPDAVLHQGFANLQHLSGAPEVIADFILWAQSEPSPLAQRPPDDVYEAFIRLRTV